MKSVFFPSLLFILGSYCGVCLGDVVKRSDDPTPLEAVVARLSSDLQELQAKHAALSSKVEHNSVDIGQNIAFTVGLKTNILANIAVGMTIKFDNVIYNAGNGYDHVDGQFQAPVAGTYVFYFKTEVASGQTVILELYREGHAIAHIFAGNSNTFETAGDLEVVHLNKGERLWVVKHGGTDGYLRGMHGTRFSGFLLEADDSTA